MSAIASISLRCLGIPIRIRCKDPGALRLLHENFAAMQKRCDEYLLDYEIVVPESGGSGRVERRGLHTGVPFADHGELIHALEGDLVVQLQLLLGKYLFVHSAVLTRNRQAILLVGESGAGKSTTCWGLLHHGFGYLSDELAPIDVGTGNVQPYAHALCVKKQPPSEFPLPPTTLKTSRGFHVPVAALPSERVEADLPITRIFFVEHGRDRAASSVTRVSRAEAAARLYPNILNALAHPNGGSDATVQLAKSAVCYLSSSVSLADTCRLIAGEVSRPSR